MAEADPLDGRHARFELKTLLDTSRMLIESTDLDFVLNNLLLISMGKLFAPKAAILLRDPTDRKFRVAKNKGRTPFHEGQELPLPDPSTYGDTVYLDASHSEFPELLAGNGLPHLFQLRTRAQHMGFLVIGDKASKQPYSDREIEFLENLVNISAVAISNSLLVRELRQTNLQLDRKVQELHTLFDLSKEFNATVDRDPMLRVFKFALLGQMFIRSFLFVKKRRAEAPECLVHNGLKQLPDEAGMTYLLDLPDGHHHVGDRLRQESDLLAENGLQAVVTLSLQDERAILAVGPRATGDPYSESDFNFLSSLGNLALLSVQKTDLLRERIEKERIEEELSIARTIQERLLPNPLPKDDRLDLAAMNVSSRQVGGDYYDAVRRGDELYLAIADVTGKGIPASLLMANLQAMLHILTPLERGICEITGKINDVIYKNTPSDKFISFFWARFDSATGVFEYVNAGHNPPFLLRAGEDPIPLAEGGMLLGAMPTFVPYSSGTLHLGPGDLIALYTDGVSEAMDPADEEYGEERLLDVLMKNRVLSAADILNAVVEDVRRFTHDKYSDDITLLVIKHR